MGWPRACRWTRSWWERPVRGSSSRRVVGRSGFPPPQPSPQAEEGADAWAFPRLDGTTTPSPSPPRSRGTESGLRRAPLVADAAVRLCQAGRGRGGGRGRDHSNHAPTGLAGFALVGVDDAQRPVRPIQADGQVDETPAVFALRRGQVAGHHGDVALVDLTLGEGAAEGALRGGVAGHEHEAGGGHVQAVDDQGIRIDGLDPGAQAVLLVLAPTGDREQAGGFVEDQEVVVGVEEGEGHGAAGVG